MLNHFRGVVGQLQWQMRHGYIFMKNSEDNINPEVHRGNVSYMRPDFTRADFPRQPKFIYKLNKQQLQTIARKQYEDYKYKMLTGKVDKQPPPETNSYWGDEEVPQHYYLNISKVQLMGVSHPQQMDVHDYLQLFYKQRFTSSLPAELVLTREFIERLDFHELVQASLLARAQECKDGELWYSIERKYHSGEKMHNLSADELISLKYAFDGRQKYGTPKFHQVLCDLLNEDVPTMSKQSLIHLFYACRYSNPTKINPQIKLLRYLQPHYKHMDAQQRIGFLLTYTICSKPLKLGREVERHRFQYRMEAHNIIFKMHLEQVSLSDSTCCQLLYVLAKLRAINTRHLSGAILDHINANFDRFASVPKHAYFALVYLPQVEGGEGVYDADLFARLKRKVADSWTSYDTIQQLRVMRALWNWNLVDQQFFALYRNIKVEPQSSILYYFAQIQPQLKGGHGENICLCLTKLVCIPLPYYLAFKRFFNFMPSYLHNPFKAILDKLTNTEYYYDSQRYRQKFYDLPLFANLKKFEQYAQLAMLPTEIAVNNLEVVQFAFMNYQISLDVVTNRQFIPGTRKLKQSYMQKVYSLQRIGWKHLTLHEEDLKGLSVYSQVANLFNSYKPYAEAQKKFLKQLEKARTVQLCMLRTEMLIRDLKAEGLEEFARYMKDFNPLSKAKPGKKQKYEKLLKRVDEFREKIRNGHFLERKQTAAQ